MFQIFVGMLKLTVGRDIINHITLIAYNYDTFSPINNDFFDKGVVIIGIIIYKK